MRPTRGPAVKLPVLGGWDLEMWASTTSVHVYDFLSGMAGTFGRREARVLAVAVERRLVRSAISQRAASGVVSEAGWAGVRG
jgi:hypothetical protein